MVFRRKYGVLLTGGTVLRIPILVAGSADQAGSGDWTPAAGDVKISKDGGAEANIGTLPTATNNAWHFILSATELQAKQVTIRVVDSATKAVDDQFIIVETYGHASAMHPVDPEDVVRMAMTALPNAAADAAGGLVISDAGGLDIDSKLATATSALATSTALATVDTVVDAIKVTTDQFVFTVANQVDANDLSGGGGGGGGGGLDAADIRSALGMSSANLDAQLADIPTVSEFNARTLVAADYFDPATDTVARVTLVDTTTTNTDMRGTNSALLASTNGSGLTAIPDMATVTNQTAIKAVTDQFVFTVANQVDSNALSGGGGLDAADIRSALGMSSANLDAQLADIPTVSEFNARTLVAADYFDPATDTVAHVTLVDTTTTNTDLVTAAAIRSEIDSNSTKLAAIVADTNELQTDWADGGRLDMILDARASQSSVDTVDGIVDDILLDTAEIGTAGVGLSSVPWNASWDAELQSGCGDALAAFVCDTGIGLAKMGEMLAAMAAGKVMISSSAGVTTLDYKKRDGATTSFTVVVTDADKTRETTGSLS
jgi:hypothetical protein